MVCIWSLSAHTMTINASNDLETVGHEAARKDFTFHCYPQVTAKYCVLFILSDILICPLSNNVFFFSFFFATIWIHWVCARKVFFLNNLPFSAELFTRSLLLVPPFCEITIKRHVTACEWVTHSNSRDHRSKKWLCRFQKGRKTRAMDW